MSWSAQDLAEQAGLHRATIQRMERRNGIVRGHAVSLDAVLTAFDDVGIEFILENGTIGVIQKIDAVSPNPSK